MNISFAHLANAFIHVEARVIRYGALFCAYTLVGLAGLAAVYGNPLAGAVFAIPATALILRAV